VISQVLCSTNFVSTTDLINSSTRTCSFRSCSNLVIWIKMWLLSMRCEACAFGKHGYTNVHPHETPYSYPTSLVWWCRYLIVKGAATEPRVPCVLQPHDCHWERARYLGCEIATRHTDPPPTLIAFQSSTHMGSWVILTCIMSTIPHWHTHCINVEKCCTFKTTSCQNLEICKISKGVSKIIPWSSTWSHLSYKSLWNSVISFPFLCNDLLGILDQLVPCRESWRSCSINSFFR
jgi:hypothetical protein